MTVVHRLVRGGGRRGETRALVEIPPRAEVVWSAANVTAETALTVPAVARCLDLLAAAPATLPMTYERRVRGVYQRVDSMPTLLRSPSALVSPEAWLFGVFSSLALHGNAFGVITRRDAAGWPQAVELVDPRTVVWRVDRQLPGVRWQVAGEDVDPDDVWHVALDVPAGAVVGRSTLDRGRQVIGLALALIEFTARWFGDGAHPTVTLSTDQSITAEQAQAILDKITAKQRRREPLILGNGIKVDRWQADLQQSQVSDLMRHVNTQIALLFGVPAEEVGGTTGDSMTYSNAQSRLDSLFRLSLRSRIRAVELAISRLLPGSGRVRFDTDDFLRLSPSDMVEMVTRGVGGPVWSRDEGRVMLGFPAEAGGNE